MCPCCYWLSAKVLDLKMDYDWSPELLLHDRGALMSEKMNYKYILNLNMNFDWMTSLLLGAGSALVLDKPRSRQKWSQTKDWL